jgi:hypothetical protein
MRAVRLLGFVGCLSQLCGSTLTAQAKTPSTEVGTSLGLTILSAPGTRGVTQFGLPGEGIQASPTLYATFFTSPSVMIEPQIAFSLLAGSGNTVTSLGLAVQVGYLFSPAQSGSAYLAANAAFQTVNLSSGFGSASGPGFGAALGYRFKVRNNVAIRVDGRYRRWFSDYQDLNEIGLGLGLGALF